MRNLRSLPPHHASLRLAGESAKQVAGDSNANALDIGLDAINAFLAVADEDYARGHASGVMANVVAKAMSGRPKTVERGTETAMLLCELEAGETVVEALLKGTKHRVPKVALASVEALRRAVASFGTPTVIPPKPILKGVSHLFESKDGKTRDAAKELTVELTRWLGPDAVRRDLVEKMRAGMQVEVTELMSRVEVGSARATRRTRKDAAADGAEAADEAAPMDVDGFDGAQRRAAAAPPDAYDFADPEDVLGELEKTPKDKEQLKFWDGVSSSKWKERLGALTRLREIADAPKLASGDYGDVARAIKKVVTKDANIACVGEACAAAGCLAKGLRREFRSEARLVLPGMLDKLKDKNNSVVAKNRDALLEFTRHCFTVADVAEEASAALGHKMPKVPAQTLGWIAAAYADEKSDKSSVAATHKSLVPAIVKCADHKEPDVRAAAIDALAAIGRAGGGFKTIARHVDALDDAKKAKIEEACANGSTAPATKCASEKKPLAAVDVNKPALANATAASKPSIGRGRPASAAPSRAGAMTNRPAHLATAGGNAPGGVKPSLASSDAAALEPASSSPPSKEEAAEALASTYGAGVVDDLKSGEWKRRLAGVGAIRARVDATSESDLAGLCEPTARGMSAFPGPDEKNFQVSGGAFGVFAELARRAPVGALTKRDAARLISLLAEKVADVKLRGPASEALTALAEALGPAFVVQRLRERATGHKNPKVVAESLLWVATATSEFGVARIDVGFQIKWCKECLALPNPACKSAAGKALGALHAGVGPGLRQYLTDVKDAQLKSLEAEFARNPHDPGNAGVGTRIVRAAEGGANDAAASVGGGLPRADISALVTEKLTKEMSDASWKVRAAAVDSVDEMLASAGRRIAPNTGELLPALAKRFADSNRNIAVSSLTAAGKVIEAMGEAAGERRHNHGVLGDVVKQMGDSKPNVRAAACGALDRWVVSAGLAKTLPGVSSKMVELTGKMSGDGKADALGWMLCALRGPAGEAGACEDLDLACAIAAAATGLSDSKAPARAAGSALADEVIRRVGSGAALALCDAASVPPALRSFATAHVEKQGAFNGAGVGAPASVDPSPSTSPTKPSKRGAASRSTTGLSSLRASRSGVSTARGSVAASSIAELARSAEGGVHGHGAVLLANDEKESRLKKLPKKPVKFEVPRDEQLRAAEEELKLALAPYVRADVHAALFKDFKSHIHAMELLTGAMRENPELCPGNLDLLLRWVVLRFCEQAPNTQSLLKTLDFTADALATVKDLSVRLSEQEAALFLPALVDKCGHAMEAVREKFRKILRVIPGLFPASRLAGYLVRGLDSKNTKTRLEVVDVMETLMERHGLDVVERGGSKALAELAKHADARDAATRTAAINCLVFAYKVGGEDVWRHIGRVGGLVKDALEDKFLKASREMDRKNEGRPGAWLKNGSLVGAASDRATSQTVGAVPVPAALAGASVSRSIAAPGRLAATASAVGSPIAAAAAAVLRPIGAAVSSMIPGRRTPPRTREPAVAPESASALEEPDDERVGASLDARLDAGWRRSLVAAASVSDAAAVEGMKSLCHDAMAAAGDEAALRAMAADADYLVGILARRVAPIFDAMVAAPGPSTTRAGKYVLNTMMQVFQEPTLAGAVGEENERVAIATLLERLLDNDLPRMDEGPQLIKALNVLMLKVLEHCPKTSSFTALLRLLATPPDSVARDPEATAKFHELVVKCLIKLTKTLGATLKEVDLPALLLEVHAFFDALGVDEIRRRGRAGDGGDKPLRMVKTILHKVTEIIGHDVYDHMGLCPPRHAEPAPIIYAYVELNLRSMPNAPGVPRAFTPRAEPDEPDEPEREPEPVAARAPSPPARASSPARAPSPAPARAPPPARSPAPARAPSPAPSPAPAPPPRLTPEASAFRARSTPAAKTPAAKTPAATVAGAGGGDVEMVDAFRPATPVSADLKSRLAGIFKKIGEKATTAKGLEELFDFSREFPMVDIQPHLARTSGAFQNYIKRGLGKVEAARAQQAAALAAATPSGRGVAQPAIEASPMPQMERTAAEVYRERLARIQRGESAASSAPAPAPAAAASSTGLPTASAGLTTLRERMNRIAAKAGTAGASAGVVAPRAPPDAQSTFDDLQARMERIRAGTKAARQQQQ